MKKFKSYFVLSFIAILSLICSSCTIERDEEFNNSSSISVNGDKYFIYQSFFNKSNTGDIYFSAILYPDTKEPGGADEFVIVTSISSQEQLTVGEDITDRTSVRDFKYYFEPSVHPYSYEELSGSIKVVSVDKKYITLQFNNFTFSNIADITFCINGTLKYKRDGVRYENGVVVED